MRIRPFPRRPLAAPLAVALCALVAALGPATAQQAAPPDRGSPTTERILSQLRAGKALDADAGGDASSGTDDGGTQADPPRDGSLAAPAAEAGAQDGILRETAIPGPADGDLAADGQLVTPTQAADPALDPADGETDSVSAPATTLPPDTRIDARTAAGRRRAVPLEDGGPPARPPVVFDAGLADIPTEDDIGDDPATAAPAPRPRILDPEDNPFAPVGYRIGGFTLLPGITSQAVYSDNVVRSQTDRQGDFALVLRPGMTLASQWSRHALSLDVRGLTSSHARLKSEDDRQLQVNAHARLDITARSNLEADAGYDFGQLSRSNPVVPLGAAQRPNIHTTSLGAAFNQRLNRLSLRVHGVVADTDQGDGGSGGLRYRDGGLDMLADYEVSPALTVFASARTLGRRFAGASGIDARDNELRLGVEVDPTVKLSGAFSVGAASAAALDGSLASDQGLIGDATVTWLPSALTTLTVAASSNLLLTSTGGATALRESRFSLDVTHQLRRWFALLAGISATKRTYAGLALAEQDKTGHVGFEYDLNRDWALLGDFQRTELSSSDAGRGYPENRLTLGLRLQR